MVEKGQIYSFNDEEAFAMIGGAVTNGGPKG
jgi:hypothetical protein